MLSGSTLLGPRAVFLDRDGVINAMVATSTGMDSPQRAGEFRLREGAPEAIRQLNSLHMPVVVVSNQPGVAKGRSTLSHLARTTSLMTELLEGSGAHVDRIYYCLHHPEALVTEYRMVCDCRKPRPGLLIAAAKELRIELAGSYMVGDRGTDIEAGAAVGCTTILVSSEATEREPMAGRPDHVCDSLRAAARWVVQHEGFLPQVEERNGDLCRHG